MVKKATTPKTMNSRFETEEEARAFMEKPPGQGATARTTGTVR